MVAVVSVSLFAATYMLGTEGFPDFYVGVEFAYSNDLTDSSANLRNLKGLVDRVKDYTNLFVVGLPEISLDESVLNEACDYISAAGLHFIILFTNTTKYPYAPSAWTSAAKQKYGEKFLAVYRIDEPGGSELDNDESRFLNPADYNPLVRDYARASEQYVSILQGHFDYLHGALYPRIFTADYAFYWFDYKGGFDAVFAEFGWNHSRPLNVALCRGAAQAFNRDWGVSITWTYRQPPYLESGAELFNDMVFAYNAGAKYVVVFSHPMLNEYGLLQEEHFTAMEKFWDYVNRNPQNHGANQGKVAYVLPADYAYGFRSSDDHIWGLWQADALSPKVWADVNLLAARYLGGFDIVCDDAGATEATAGRYERLFFWNETLT